MTLLKFRLLYGLLLCCTIYSGILNISAQTYEVRALDAFNSLHVGKQIAVSLHQGATHKVEILPTYKIWNEDVVTNVEKNTLKLTTKANFADTVVNCKLEFKDTLHSLLAINGGTIKTDSGVVIKVNSLEVGAGLATEINLVVDVKVLQVNASDGAKLNISGRANKVIIMATSGSKIEMNNLICDDASVKCSLGAKVWLTANINYWANAVSGGKIYYGKAPLLKFEKKRSTGGNIELITQ